MGTATSTMMQEEPFVFTITNTRTPSSKVDPNNIAVTTQDDKDEDIDGPTNCATEQITAGALAGPTTRFDSGTDTPGVSADATVTFTTKGQIETGGKIQIVLPDETAGANGANKGWRMAATPTITNAQAWAGTAAWDQTNRVLVITTATAEIPQDTEVVFTVGSVRTPSSFRTSGGQAPTTTKDDKNKIVDGPTDIATDAITSPLLTTPLSFALQATPTDLRTPGVRSTATVKFVATGQILIGGKIDIVFPNLAGTVQQGWRYFTTAPTIAVSQPASVTATSAWDSANRKLVITTAGADIADGASVEFTVADTMTPSGAVAANNVVITTRDPNGRTTDADTNAATDVITESVLTDGSLPNGKKFMQATAKNTPGVTSTSTVAFTTNGQVLSGGHIVLIFPDVADGTTATPDEEWRIKDGSTGCGTITFSKPAGTGVTGSCTWNPTTRSLDVTTGGADIGDGTAAVDVEFTVTDVKTPSSIVVANNIATSTKDSLNAIVDGPTNIATDEITAGQMTAGTNGINWKMSVDTPGYMSTATMTFKTTGEIKAGHHVDIVLPDLGYTVPATGVPHVMRPTQDINGVATEYVFATSAYNTVTRTLTITTSNGDIPEDTDVEITLCHVKTPPTVTAAGTAAQIKSYDNRVTANKGTTDEPVAMATEAVTAGALRAHPSWGKRFGTMVIGQGFTPGVGIVPKINFSTRGEVQSGGKILITIPDDGWDISVAAFAVTVSELTGVTATAAWDSANRLLTITTATAAIPQDTPVTLNVGTTATVTTPLSVKSAATAATTTAHSDDGVIDGPTNLDVDEVVAGIPTGDLTFKTVFDTPGVTQTVTVSCTLIGKLAIGGKIVLVLPEVPTANKWSMGSTPTIAFTTGPTGLTGTGAFDATRTLTITTADADIPEATALVFTIADVKTPSGALPAYSSGSITTTLTGGETVDTTALHTEAILAGSNSRSLWEPSDTTPGKTSSVTLRFYTHGEIPVGGNIGVRLPPNDGWGFP